jgi:hypothetical protein
MLKRVFILFLIITSFFIHLGICNESILKKFIKIYKISSYLSLGTAEMDKNINIKAYKKSVEITNFFDVLNPEISKLMIMAMNEQNTELLGKPTKYQQPSGWNWGGIRDILVVKIHREFDTTLKWFLDNYENFYTRDGIVNFWSIIGGLELYGYIETDFIHGILLDDTRPLPGHKIRICDYVVGRCQCVIPHKIWKKHTEIPEKAWRRNSGILKYISVNDFKLVWQDYLQDILETSKKKLKIDRAQLDKFRNKIADLVNQYEIKKSALEKKIKSE